MTKAATKTVSRSAATGQFRAEPSRKALHQEMRVFAHELKSDRTKARKFLVEAGIVTEKGNLKKAYRE